MCLAAPAIGACSGGTLPFEGNETDAGFASRGGDHGDTLPDPSGTSSVSAGDAGSKSSTDPGDDGGPGNPDSTNGNDTVDPDDSGDGSTSDGGDGSSSSSSGNPPLLPIDISGWTVVQTDSYRTFTIPDGTILEPGGYVVIGRDATLSQFEAGWGTSFGPEVIYFNSVDAFPVVNGGETYTLTDDVGATVEGPTPAMIVGRGYQRSDATLPATDAGAWTESVDPNTSGTPGAGQSEGTGAVQLTEYSDTLGSGNFVFEFVELYYG